MRAIPGVFRVYSFRFTVLGLGFRNFGRRHIRNTVCVDIYASHCRIHTRMTVCVDIYAAHCRRHIRMSVYVAAQSPYSY